MPVRRFVVSHEAFASVIERLSHAFERTNIGTMSIYTEKQGRVLVCERFLVIWALLKI